MFDTGWTITENSRKQHALRVSHEDGEFLQLKFGSGFFQHPLSTAEIDQVSSALKERWAAIAASGFVV